MRSAWRGKVHRAATNLAFHYFWYVSWHACLPASLSFCFVYMNGIDMCNYFCLSILFYYYMIMFLVILIMMIIVNIIIDLANVPHMSHTVVATTWDHWAAEPISGNLAAPWADFPIDTSIPSGIPLTWAMVPF